MTLAVFGPRCATGCVAGYMFGQVGSGGTYTNPSAAFLTSFATLTRPILNISAPSVAGAGPTYLSYAVPVSESNQWAMQTIPSPQFTGACTPPANVATCVVFFEVEIIATVSAAVAASIDPEVSGNELSIGALNSIISAESMSTQGLCNSTATFYCPTNIILRNYSIITPKVVSTVRPSTSSEFQLAGANVQGAASQPPPPAAGLNPSSTDVYFSSDANAATRDTLAPWVTGYITITNGNNGGVYTQFGVMAALQVTICHSLGCPWFDGSGNIRPASYGRDVGLISVVDVWNYLSQYVEVNATQVVPSPSACSSTQTQYMVALRQNPAHGHLHQFTTTALAEALINNLTISKGNQQMAYKLKIGGLLLNNAAQEILPGTCAQVTTPPTDLSTLFSKSVSQYGDGSYEQTYGMLLPLFGFIGDLSGCTHTRIPAGNPIFTPAYADKFIDPSVPLATASDVTAAANASTPSPMMLNITASAGSTLVLGVYPLSDGLAGVGNFMTVQVDRAGLVIYPQISARLSLKLQKVNGGDMEQAKAFYANSFLTKTVYTPEWKLDIGEAQSTGSAFVSPPAQIGRPGARSFLLNIQPYFIGWEVPYTAEVFSYGVADAIVASLTYFNTVLLLLGLFVPALLVHWHRKSRDVIHATLMNDREAAKAAFDTTLYDARELALRNKLVDLEAAIVRVEGLFENKSDAWVHQAEMRRLLGMQPQPPKVAPKEEFATPAAAAKGGRTPAGAVQLTSPPPGSTLWKCSLPSCNEANKRMYVECPKCGAKYCGEKHRQEHWTKGHAATCRLGMKR
jgi:hypothetical protein